MIVWLQPGPQGPNPRFVLSSLPGECTELYERLYCARAEAENRIKEIRLDLFGRRASGHRFAANQLRLLQAAFADTQSTDEIGHDGPERPVTMRRTTHGIHRTGL